MQFLMRVDQFGGQIRIKDEVVLEIAGILINANQTILVADEFSIGNKVSFLIF